MPSISRPRAIFAGLLAALLILSAIAVAAPVKISVKERFAQLTQSSCPTCNTCTTCSGSTTSPIQEKLSLLPLVKAMNFQPAERHSFRDWSVMEIPPFGCPPGGCV